jgi:thioredoxin-like negative regulator of GroEL
VFERATRAHPDHAAIQYHFAIALHRNNQTKQAMQVLAQLIQSFSEFDNKAQAQMLLWKLKTSVDVSS